MNIYLFITTILYKDIIIICMNVYSSPLTSKI